MAKEDKTTVNYSLGKKQAHCGPVDEWQYGDCKHFRQTNPPSCTKVYGVINPMGWCMRWEKKDHEDVRGKEPEKPVVCPHCKGTGLAVKPETLA